MGSILNLPNQTRVLAVVVIHQGGLREKVPADASKLVFECCAIFHLSVSNLFFTDMSAGSIRDFLRRIAADISSIDCHIADDLVTGLAPIFTNFNLFFAVNWRCGCVNVCYFNSAAKIEWAHRRNK